MCLIASLAVVNGASAADIEARLRLRRVSVSVTSAAETGVPTLQLLNEDKTKMLYAAEGTQTGDGCVFESFSFPMNAASGSYILRVGGSGEIAETAIKYTAYDEAVQSLKTIDGDKNAALGQLSAYPELFGTTAEQYSQLGVDWKKRLEKEISEIDIKFSSEEEATAAIESISSAVEKITDWAMLTDSSDEESIKKAINAISGLDTKLLGKLDSLSPLKKAFAAQNIDKMNVTADGIVSAFDGAVLVSVINGSDWGTGREALSYYADKGLLSIESKYLESGSEVYKRLKNEAVLNYKEIPEKLKAAYKEVNSGGSSGGGSGSSGGVSAGKVNRVSATGGNGEAAASTSFNDLGEAEWARTAIEALAEKKIISGRGNGSFAPNETVTRAEFAKMIVGALALTDETAEAEFDDLPKSAWYYRAVASAKKAGLVNGISETEFGAEMPIKRCDMAVIVLRAARLANIQTNGDRVEFSDADSIPEYARDAVESLSAAGIVNGMGDGTFSPSATVTRAQAAQIIYSLSGRKG